MELNTIEVREKLLKDFSNLISKQSFPHAILLNSSQSDDLLNIALIIAQALLCEKNNQYKQNQNSVSLFGGGEASLPKESKLPCGQCDSCLKVKKSIHLDLHFLFPTFTIGSSPKIDKKNLSSLWRGFLETNTFLSLVSFSDYLNSEGKNPHIPVERIEEFIKINQFKSYEGICKVSIIWLPEYLGHNANKILKLIEEPPPKSYFIFVTEEKDLILKTLLSRLRIFEIPALENEWIEKLFEDTTLNLSEFEKIIFTHISQKSVLKGSHFLKMLESDIFNFTFEWIASFYKNKFSALDKSVKAIQSLKKNQQVLMLEILNDLFEYFYVYDKNSKTEEPLLFNLLQQIAKELSYEQYIEIQNQIQKTTYYLKRNANTSIVFYSLGLKISTIVNQNYILTI